ncbi:MAG: bifunctional (p)ppGpp synthetase/guanosine-3',5'-bis(diphosphate) 3'-pyrophosphohydrolase [Firmicutes bacterium]|nr:bifunctional (p)ppGpp synthetase/guanosine-3',5'-bis(diphosphate) 3'-pyrophosphohydrolase [Bacillota bacterium]
MDLKSLLERITSYYPDADLEIIIKAYDFAKAAHEGQLRDSGEPFFNHPFEVALILADLELDLDTVAAGLLHDVIEDTDVTPEELEQEFGSHIFALVDGVTKLEKLPFKNRLEREAENLRKMIFAMAKDIRVILIKLADRLHNMRTLRYLDQERQIKIARETLDIYAPLANRLGIWTIKWEIEDIAFRYLWPERYYELVNQLSKKRQERENDLQLLMQILQDKLAELGITAEIQGRPKHLYSIYQKMERQDKSLNEIYDLLAVRVIVDSVRDCYAVLGAIHTLWKPIPGRFKDYIAMPKSNMYQSLHTTIIGPHGELYEIQIRTWEMHRIAEKGVAAHWMYKEGMGSKKDETVNTKVQWLREAVEWLQDMKDPQEFMESLKIDLFEDEVFVFTPKGDVKALPTGSTPVDFAFDVHTDIGLRCIGAKVNGKIQPLDYQLKNGEFVEILTSKTANPSQDWLSFVKTSKARNKIRSWLKEEQRDVSVMRGREQLEKELKKHNLEIKEYLAAKKLTDTAKRYGYSNPDDLFASIGFGRINANQVVQKLAGKELEERRRDRQLNRSRQPRHREAKGVAIKGVDNLLVRFSKCCTPVPGDEIVGYVTRGRGVSIHRTDCPNVQSLSQDSGRQIEVAWNTSEKESFPVDLELKAVDRMNMLSAIMNTIAEGQTNIEAVNTRKLKDDIALILLTVDIYNLEHMQALINRLRQVDGVVSVRRATPT